MDTNPAFEIELLYFAALRERMQRSSETVQLPGAVRDVRSLKAWLEEQRAPLSGALDAVRFAIGDAFVDLEHPLEPGDVVALLPPVSGG